jgi:hypothetical protein
MTGVREPGRQAFWGQTMIAAALAAAFVIPYGAARLWSESRDTRWLTSGLTVAEINEWRESGFTEPADAIRWRNARFKGPGARLWTEEGWRDAADAARWFEADFGAREATRWRDLGFAAHEARPWREAGFLPADARQWKDAQVEPADAAIRRRNGRDPR